jgi:hypothetical protein
VEFSAAKPEKVATIKLLRPVTNIPANHPYKAKRFDGFWWIGEKRIADSNIQFVK